jgi:hypothetical protein
LLRRETKLAAFIEGLVASGTIERSTGELLLATRTGVS